MGKRGREVGPGGGREEDNLSGESEIVSRVEKTGEVAWESLVWIQGKLKSIDNAGMERLKRSLMMNNFIDPFRVWESEGRVYCLDGHHRQKAMNELKAEGVKIPALLPAVWIRCVDMREAKKMVLLYSSRYAMTSEERVREYLEDGGMDVEAIGREVGYDLAAMVLDGEVKGRKEEVLLDDAVQLMPQREYVVIMCGEGNPEWEELKGVFGLKTVRRGGYRLGSPFDAVGTDRVVHAGKVLDMMKRRGNGTEE